MVVDSLINHFKAEYTGRSHIKHRDQRLHAVLHQLLQLTNRFPELVVVYTNQVEENLDQFFGDPTIPLGGHVVAHANTIRIYLRVSKGERRIARTLKSPLPEYETVFAITKAGVEDVE